MHVIACCAIQMLIVFLRYAMLTSLQHVPRIIVMQMCAAIIKNLFSTISQRIYIRCAQTSYNGLLVRFTFRKGKVIHNQYSYLYMLSCMACLRGSLDNE